MDIRKHAFDLTDNEQTRVQSQCHALTEFNAVSGCYDGMLVWYDLALAHDTQVLNDEHCYKPSDF